MSRVMNRALNIACTALLLPALLIGCGAAPAQPAPAQPAPAQPAPTAPKPLTPTVRPIGAIELNVDTRDSTVRAQAITPGADSSVSFPTAGRFTEVIDVGANRYIMARFPITANQNFGNLTLVAYNKTGNEAGSAFKAFQSFGGSPSAANVYSLRPAHGVNASAVVNPNKADLQVLTTAEAQSVTTAAQGGGTPIIAGGEYALEYGYVARRCTANCGTTPTWTRAISSGETGQVTVAVRVPQSGDPGSGYRFTMTFIVSNDTSTQYSQSLEEIASNTVAGIAQTNAAVTGATSVRILCNSTYSSANKAFVLGARTAGNGATPLAQYGAQFYRNATPASFSVTPNTIQTFNPGVAPLYTALNGATVTYGGGSSVNGGNVSVATNGSFDFNPKAGSTINDTMNFTVSDDQGCSAAPQTTPVSISGPVIWYVNSAFAGTSDGRKSNPFKTTPELTAPALAGHAIFLYQGSYGALTLKANQTLIGQFEGLAVLGNAVVPVGTGGSTTIEAAAGTIPVLTASSGNTLTLTNGTTTVRGVKLGGVAAGVALSGTSFGTLNISNSEIASSGAAINLDTGALSATFKSVSSSGGVNGVKLNAITGAGLTVTGTGTTAGSGGTIQSSTGIGIEAVNVSAINMQYMVVQNTGSHGVAVDTTGSNTASTITIRNNNFRNMASPNWAVFVELFATSNNNFDISSNTVGGATAGSAATTDMNGIRIEGCNPTTCNSATLFQGRINSNDIRLLPTGNATGIDVNHLYQGKMLVEIKSNTVQNYGLFALDLSSLGGNNANLQATVQNNNLSLPTANALQGMRILVGADSATINTLCLNLTGNTITSSIAAILLRQRINSTFALQGLTGTPVTNATTVQNFVNAQNTLSLGSSVSPASATNTVNYTSATCQVPSF